MMYVWHCNPLVLLEHQLANLDFDGSIDYAPKVVTDERGERCRDWYVSVGVSSISPTFPESPSTLISSPPHP